LIGSAGEDAADGIADPDIDRRRTVAAQLIRLPGERRRIDPMLGEKGGAAEHHLPSFDLANRALAGRRVEIGDIGDGDLSFLGSHHDRPRKRMLDAAPRRREPQDGLLDKSWRRNDPGHRRLAFVSVPVLSTTSVSIFSIRSSASAFLIRTPAAACRYRP
jgi:hypothetical protein